VPLRFLEEVILPVEGLEALRLADVEGLDHEAAGARMNVSRPTFTRVLAEARSVVARALVNGWAIRVEGGHYEVAEDQGAAPCRGRGRGRHGFHGGDESAQ
jgi:predicted DNA-binding protein (UPF0251 family)